MAIDSKTVGCIDAKISSFQIKFETTDGVSRNFLCDLRGGRDKNGRESLLQCAFRSIILYSRYNRQVAISSVRVMNISVSYK